MLVEATKQTGESEIDVLTEIIGTFGFNRIAAAAGGGAANSASSGQTNLHFFDTHTMAMPLYFAGPCDDCATQGDIIPIYISEIDPRWRNEDGVPLVFGAVVDALGAVAGGNNILAPWYSWGRAFPRIGHVIHGSEPVGAALAATRAMHISVDPVGLDPTQEPRPVRARLDLPIGTCIQMARPRQTPCFNVGTPPTIISLPPAWDVGTVSSRGTYIYLFWRQKVCCVDGAAVCGIAQFITSGRGENFCFPLSVGFGG